MTEIEKQKQNYLDWAFEYLRSTNDDDELDDFIQIFFNLKLPRDIVVPGNSSPFEFIADTFFERENNTLCIGNRNGGKTMAYGLKNTLDGLFKGCEIASIGAIVSQAEKQYSYTQEFLNKPLIKQYVPTSIMKHTKVITPNGSSTIQILPGTMNGVNCLLKSTLIDCPRDNSIYPDGIPLGDLVGKEFYTYSLDIEKERFVLKKASNVHCSGKKVPVYKVNFEWIEKRTGEKKTGNIIGTNHHPILTKNGEYKQIDELVPGDRLQPFGQFIHKKIKSNREIITRILTIAKNEYIQEHRFIYKELYDNTITSKDHIHHKDENHQNNIPENLEKTNVHRHIEKHSKYKTYINRGSKKLIEKKVERKVRKEVIINNFDYQQKDFLEYHILELGKSAQQLATELGLSKQCVLKWMKKYNIVSHQQQLIKAQTQQNNIQIEEYKNGNIAQGERKTNVRRRSRDIINNENHVVTSVEFYGYEDVYDMSVEDTHNFVANGIVVHNSPHPQKANVDEVELMEWKILQEAMSMPCSKGNTKASLCMTSSRKFSYGNMELLLTEAEKRMLKIYKWSIWETIERCQDDRSGKIPCKYTYAPYGKDEPETINVFTSNPKLYDKEIFADVALKNPDKYTGCLACPLVQVCKTKAKKSNGFYRIDDTIMKFRIMDREVWDSQWESLKPMTSGLIYKQYSDETHCLFGESQWKYNPNYICNASLDAGFEHPAVMSFFQEDMAMNVFMFDEIIKQHTTSHELVTLHWLPKLIEYGFKNNPKKCVYYDPSAKDESEQLKAHGIKMVPANNEVDPGIKSVRAYLKTAGGKIRFYVNECCENARKEFKSYHYKENSEIIYKLEDDSMDTVRYYIHSRHPLAPEKKTFSAKIISQS